MWWLSGSPAFAEAFADAQGLGRPCRRTVEHPIGGTAPGGADAVDPHRLAVLPAAAHDGRPHHIYRALPDPVWWLSGSPAFAEAFADGFLAHLKRLNETAGG